MIFSLLSMVTEIRQSELDTALRLLARMIARAHLKQVTCEYSEQVDSEAERISKRKEGESHADKRSI